jgi:hypothetical protein
MHNLTLPGIAALGLLIPAAPLYAHHGTAGYYDRDKIVSVQGTVREFWLRNPHSVLVVDTRDESGKVISYTLQMGSLQALTKLGYTRTTLKPGDKVTLPMHPSFANPVDGEALTGDVTVNGTKLKDASGPASAKPTS